MATPKKAPAKTATSGGAGAVPPTTSQIPGYTGATGSGNTPTALQATPYAVVPFPQSWGNTPVPNDQIGVTTPGAPRPKGISAAAMRAEAVSGLAKYFNLKDRPGVTMEQQVLDALAAKYGVQATSPGSVGTKTIPAHGGVGRGHSRVPGAGQSTTEPTSTPATPNTKALQEIAKKVGADPKQDPLVAIAGRIGIPNTMVTQQAQGNPNPLTQVYAPTAAQQYAIWVGRSFDKKGKLTKDGTQDEKALIAAGYLDINTNGGTPSSNDIQKAYQAFLGAAVNGINSGDPSTTLPPGQGMNAALTFGQQQAKSTQNAATTSESYAYTQGIASEFGVYLTPLQINQIIDDPKIAAEITSTGSPTNVADQIKDLVIKDYNPNNPNDPAGVANTMYVGIQQAALKYQIPIASDAINQMVQNGLQTASVAYPASAATDVVNKATEQFQQQAVGLYPTLASQIQAGQDVQTLTQPYLQLAQTYTGVPASTMMTDTAGGGQSIWAKFLNTANNPALAATPAANTTGNPSATQAGKQQGPQMMTLDQWKQTLMQDPQYGFQNTQGAKNLASQFTSAILNELGLVNTGTSGQGAFSAVNPSSALSANG